MASLIVASGPQEGIYLPLGKGTAVVSRGENAPLQITDPRVSRPHIQVRYDRDKDAYIALDMKSANGTFVDGVKAAGEIELKDGDRIRIGDTTIVFSRDIPKDRPNALELVKRAGERARSTVPGT